MSMLNSNNERLARKNRGGGLPPPALGADTLVIERVDVGEGTTQERGYEIFQTSLVQFTEDILQVGLDESFYQRLLERAVGMVPGAQAGSILLQDTAGRYRFVAEVGFDLAELQQLSFEVHELHVDLANLSPQLVYDYEDGAKSAEQRLSLEHAGRALDIKVSLFAPIVLEANRLALLYLDNFETRDAFSRQSLEMAGLLTKQIAALHRRLALESELNMRQRALERWSAFHAGLTGFVAETLRQGLNERFYQRLLEHAVTVIPGVGAGSILVREHDNSYHFKACVGYDQQTLRSVTFSETELLVGATRQAVLIQDLAEYNTHSLDETRLRLLERSGPVREIKAVLAVPVCVGTQLIASLSLDSFEDNVFDHDCVEMANAFAAQVGVLLQRLRLEQQLELSNAELTKLANFDSLTGLPNRVLLADRLEQSCAQARRTGRAVGLLYLDLDGFKTVNDGLGHSTGDLLLRMVAQRLTGCLRENDTVARLGGDEFAIVLSSLNHVQDALSVAQRVIACLSLPFEIGSRELIVGASIGVAVYHGNGSGVEEMLKDADTAMYQAKALGKNRYHVFTPELSQRIVEGLTLEQDMRRGLERGEFRLYYQPRVDLETGRVGSVEALLRWCHPSRGFVSPGDFIPIAERSGFIVPLSQFVLRQACQQAKAWQAEGRDIRVAVNLSVKCLQHAELLPMLTEALSSSDLEPSRLELEITESAAMTDVETNIKTLTTLRDTGLAISIDDFGTAYSSLNYLKRLPISSLKIDRSFLQDLTEDTWGSADAAIVKAIVALGKSMDFTLIAEGVETEAQVAFLQSLGCDEAQGFLFCKPLPPEQVFCKEIKAFTALS